MTTALFDAPSSIDSMLLLPRPRPLLARALLVLSLGAPLVAPAPTAAQGPQYATDAGREAIAAGVVAGALVLREVVLEEPTVGPEDFDRVWSGSSFDAPATRYASERWRAWTDRLLIGLWAGALASAVLPAAADDDERWARVLVLGETGLVTLGMTEVLKLSVGRHRPYTYNAELPDPAVEALMGPDSADARVSFPSGHASMAFAAATFSASVLTTTYDWPGYADASVWAVTLGAATATAIGRVRAGKHFPTDVIAGALLGSAVGLLVPSCHELGDGFCDLRRMEEGTPALELGLVSLPFG